MNLSNESLVTEKLFSGTNVKENTMNLSEHLCVDKELFSFVNTPENTPFLISTSLF